MDGWITIQKKILKWEWYDDTNTVRLFLHFLLKANYEDTKWHGQIVKRGQFITSLPSLVKETGITTQSLRTCIDRLKSTDEVTSEGKASWTVMTVNNYNKYQLPTDQLTDCQQTSNRQVTTANKDNKYKGIIDTAKNSLVPCTQEELYAIADKLNISDSAVKDKHETILEYIEAGEFGPGGKYKKNKTTYMTLLKWLRNDITKGYLHHMTAEDLVFREAERTPTPDWILETLKTF